MTNETKHTPGPWKAVRNEVHVGGRRICAYVTSGASLGIGPDLERSYANARLIAAAPDLLEALQMAKHIVANEGTDEQMAQVFSAIEKATGEKA